ncbi:hypothetical protein [Lentilactobacillus kosonis]|uniref:Uncharacterized protein n=1 Tax=Lentilactobacillus kosonis TaxID=2810561 RepID=A0A401FNG5_9LACO|nr:hypothetical protein [Lentilactobacillus kosonis]GAY73929.1 hypothetical protein NBRC111893_2075 [Lentilactobacillus kosonis]
MIIKIPKGTNIQVDGFKVKNGSKYAYFNIEKLSYDIRKPLIGKNTSVISAWQRLTRSNFKQIKKPTYLNYYSAIKSSRKLYNKVIQHSGSLWEGTRFPANYKSVRNDRIRITNDGYLEYFENFPYAYRVSGKPAYTEKLLMQNMRLLESI